jgi:hypothetical protein
VGSLYKRGNVWWCKFYQGGLPVRMSTENTKEKEARDFLKVREGKATEGEPVLPRAGRVRYDEARDDLKAHYETTGSRGLVEAGSRFTHLDKFFAGRRLMHITGPVVALYIAERQREEASNGTSNRELTGTLSGTVASADLAARPVTRDNSSTRP